MKQPVTTYYLEMLNQDELTGKECVDLDFWIGECGVKQFRYNRLLYDLVGDDWQWFDKRSWTDDDWRKYAEAEDLRTWVGYLGGSPAGYYELRIPAKSATHSDFGRTLIPVSSDTYRSEATLAV